MEAAHDRSPRPTAFDFLRDSDSDCSQVPQLSRCDLSDTRWIDRSRVSCPQMSEQFVYITTTGRKTGLPRQIEIWFVEFEDRLYILAEHGLKAKWVQNIIADPKVNVRLGDRQFRGVGRMLDEVKDSERYA